MAAEHKGRLYGGADVPLSDEGRAASLALAPALAAVAPDAIYSSPLQRARFLAEEVARLSRAPLRLEPAFRELDRGEWTGLSQAELEARSPGALSRYTADPEGGAAPGGERESELSARVWDALTAAARERAGQRALLVAHAHVTRVIMARLAGWTPAESMQHFLPPLGTMDVELFADGQGRLLALPPQIGQRELLRH